jgi:hypothetical protein
MLRNAVRFACIALVIAAALLWPHVGRAAEPARADMVWAACPVQDREAARDKVVRQFPRAVGNAAGRTMPAGTTNLTCGNERFGFYHIANSHGEQWEQKGEITLENWRDVADYAIQEALAHPMAVTYRTDNDTFCYSRLIFLVDKRNGETVGSYQPNVVISARDQYIVTAWPSSTPCR